MDARLWRVLCALILILLSGQMAHVASQETPVIISAEQTENGAQGIFMKTHIDRALVQQHPRLFGVADAEALRAHIQADAGLNEAYLHLLKLANATVPLPLLTREQIGRRLLGVSRACLKRLLCLSLAWRLDGDRRYLERAEQEMLSVAAFSDWNPSHFLDVAEMTSALAIAYDWLYNDLSEETRNVVKKAIKEKGLLPSLASSGNGWISGKNNWNQVCHAGMALGAIAILEDEPQLAEDIIQRAVQNVPHSMHEYAPDGAYPEGPGYWVYGTTYNVMLISALESVFGSDFNLSAMPGFMESAYYYQHVAGPDGLFFNYSDAGKEDGVTPALYWFAAKMEDTTLLWRERICLKEFIAEDPKADKEKNRFFPLSLVWSARHKVNMEITPPAKLHWTGNGATPLAMHRSSWTDKNASYLCLKGGSAKTNHAHMDIGSIVFDTLGERWVEDLGAESYHHLESQGVNLWNMKQDSQRWDIFRLNNKSHNTLVVDEQVQIVEGFAPIITYADQAPMPHTIIDMSSVYAGQLSMAMRGVGLLADNSMIMQDDIESDAAAKVRWAVLTRAKITLTNARTAQFERNGKHVCVRLLSPEQASFVLVDSAQPASELDTPNPGTTQLTINLSLPAKTKQHIVVQMTPHVESKIPFVFKELSQW